MVHTRTTPVTVRAWIRGLAALSCVVLLASGCAADSGRGGRGEPFRLAVMTLDSKPVDFRVALRQTMSVDQVKTLQSELAESPFDLQTVARAPFEKVEIRSKTSSTKVGPWLRKRLSTESLVESVSSCPCAEEVPTSARTLVGQAAEASLFAVQRTCANTTGPIPVSGCVMEYDNVSPATESVGAALRIFSFEATSHRFGQGEIRRLAGRFVSTPEIADWAPKVGDTTVTATSPHARIRFHGYRFNEPIYEAMPHNSTGQLSVRLGPDYFSVATAPTPTMITRVHLEGAVHVFVKPADPHDWRYDVLVDPR